MSREGNIRKAPGDNFQAYASASHIDRTHGVFVYGSDSAGKRAYNKTFAGSYRDRVWGVLEQGESAGSLDTVRPEGIIYAVASTAISAGTLVEPGQDLSSVRIARFKTHYSKVLSAINSTVTHQLPIQYVYDISSIFIQAKDSSPIALSESVGTVVSTSNKWCYSGSSYSVVRVEHEATAEQVLHVTYYQKGGPATIGRAIEAAAGAGSTIAVKLGGR